MSKELSKAERNVADLSVMLGQIAFFLTDGPTLRLLNERKHGWNELIELSWFVDSYYGTVSNGKNLGVTKRFIEIVEKISPGYKLKEWEDRQ